MKKVFFIFVISLLFSLAAFAQTPQPSATPPINEDEDVVKISTALIQLDVVVTDKNGDPVADLKPEDFEVTENGEKQAITNLSYFAGQKGAILSGNLSANTTGAMPTVGEVRRTVAIIVDDAGMSVQDITLLKKDLVKFINEQVQPNDLVAIIKTSRSVGIFQQFTTDKKKLLSIIENLTYQPLTSVGLSPFEPIGVSFADQIAANNAIGGGLTDNKVKSQITERETGNAESLAEINRNLTVTSGSLGVVNTTIAAMSQLPGRKSILYAAEGVYGFFDSAGTTSINNLGGTASVFTDTKKLREQLRGITEAANRATIAIYTLDPRGTLPVNFSASENMRGGMTDRELQAAQEGSRNAPRGSSQQTTNPRGNNRDLNNRSDELIASQQGLRFLSEETTGKAFINTNDLGKSLRETLDSQNGYYIVAYQPNSETFDADKRRFNKLSVKVKRPNVNVSYRSGFFNFAQSDGGKKTETPETTFARKIFSPYKSTDIDLRMTSVFTGDEKFTTIRTFVNVKAGDLKFTDDTDGNKTAKFDIIAVNFNLDGIPVAAVSKSFEIKASPQRYAQLMTDGIAYNLTFNTKDRGAQQIKVSVRDTNTLKIGTVSQLVEIPSFDKNTVGLSGILFQSYTAQEWQNLQGGKPLADAAARMQADTARRQFKKGMILSFNYAVYAEPSMRSKSQTQFTVLKDGKEVFKGTAEDLNLAPSGKLQRINRGGAFLLGSEMAAGKYVLQVSVGGDAVKTPEIQQIDFELIN